MFNFLDSIQEREKNILAGLYIAGVICFYIFIAQPTINKNGEIKDEMIKLQDMLDAPQVKKADLDALQKEIASLESGINSLKYQIPKTEKRGFLIRDLESLTKLNKIEIISFVPKEAISVTLSGQEITDKLKRYLKRRKKTAVKAKVLKTIINIDSTGEFAQYVKLFADIITYHRAVEIADLTIGKAGTTGRGVDKRFSRQRSGEGILEQLKNNELNVSFSLYAYTLMED